MTYFACCESVLFFIAQHPQVFHAVLTGCGFILILKSVSALPNN